MQTSHCPNAQTKIGCTVSPQLPNTMSLSVVSRHALSDRGYRNRQKNRRRACSAATFQMPVPRSTARRHRARRRTGLRPLKKLSREVSRVSHSRAVFTPMSFVGLVSLTLEAITLGPRTRTRNLTSELYKPSLIASALSSRSQAGASRGRVEHLSNLFQESLRQNGFGEKLDPRVEDPVMNDRVFGVPR